MTRDCSGGGECGNATANMTKRMYFNEELQLPATEDKMCAVYDVTGELTEGPGSSRRYHQMSHNVI